MARAKTPDIVICADEREFADRCARALVDAASRELEEKDSVNVSLSGGRTPLPIYRALASGDLKERIDWMRVHLFWGDERCVPADHQENNYWTAFRAFIGPLNIPAGNVHRIKAEAGEKAAAEYEEEIRRHFRLRKGAAPRFDIMILGMGPDGHTASIFPGTEAVSEKKMLVMPVYVEKLEKMRITLTPPVITGAGTTFVLATGEDKAEVLKEALTGEYRPDDLPIQLTRKSKGSVTWFVDRAAARLLERKK